ncbi:MAG: C39 family peptidase [Armatimonadota bacterium]|nr:C39 family peptidase [Armatimonadota bacterium]
MFTAFAVWAPQPSAAEGFFAFSGEESFREFRLTNAAWDPASKGIVFSSPHGSVNLQCATVESPEIKVDGGFDQAVISWNAYTPLGAYIRVYLAAKVGANWTPWYKMGLWTRDERPEPRTSFKGQDDEWGRVDTDVLVLKKPAQAIKARLELGSVDGCAYPILRFVSVCVTNTSAPRPTDAPVKSAWGRELDVPELSQLSVEGGRGWCSPTSVAMVLGYWAKKLNRPELAVSITEAAQGVYDKAWGGTGNWTFNIAFAGEFSGIRAYVTRFSNIADIEKRVLQGIPVIVSLDYNKLNRRKTEAPMGHLMVVRGFTRFGNVIFNDPWARLDKGQKVRKIFKREDLERSWLGPGGSHGTVYLIMPEEL